MCTYFTLFLKYNKNTWESGLNSGTRTSQVIQCHVSSLTQYADCYTSWFPNYQWAPSNGQCLQVAHSFQRFPRSRIVEIVTAFATLRGLCNILILAFALLWLFQRWTLFPFHHLHFSVQMSQLQTSLSSCVSNVFPHVVPSSPLQRGPTYGVLHDFDPRDKGFYHFCYETLEHFSSHSHSFALFTNRLQSADGIAPCCLSSPNIHVPPTSGG